MADLIFPNGTKLSDLVLFTTASAVTASRALGTIYQNTTGKPIMVEISVKLPIVGDAFWLIIGSTTPPDITVANCAPQVADASHALTVIVPKNWYYQCGRSTGVILQRWIEII